jgi:hypothetical protein
VVNLDPDDYEIEETDDVVTGEIEFKSRFLWRAQRFRDKMNLFHRIPSYRYEIFIEENKYVVVAMQNVLVRKKR